MKNVVDAQRGFFNSNVTKSIDFRIQQLRKLKETILKNENLLHEAIYADFKKSVFESYSSELGLVLTDIDEAIRKVRKWAKIKRIRTNLINFPARSYVVPEPLGVSLIIGAWNYPYLLTLGPIVGALAAGNTVILKPSELAPRTSNALKKIVSENFKPEYFTVVEGGISETTELLNQKFDKIFFTGSVAVGRIVYQAAAKNLTPVTLELGGKSPAIIAEDCNLKMTVKRLVWSKFMNAGQSCIAPDFVVVHRSIKQQFLELTKAEIEKSHFSFENGNYLQIINESKLMRLVDLVPKEKIYYGGSYHKENRYFEPTLLQDISFDDSVMKEEIFGPILPVLEYDNLSVVIDKIKEMPRPLSCYVFTSNKEIKNRITREISFGGGCINEAVMHISNSNFGFGGVGDSGIGAYHGEVGFKAFTHYKSILNKPTWFELNLKYYPHTANKLKLIKLIMKLW
ncbi:MAG: aldehyde dehydrogenase [Bacteroidales bacterium]